MAKQMAPLLAAVAVASVSNPAYYTFLPLFVVRELGATPMAASLAFMITPFAEIPAMVALGSLSDRAGRLRAVALCLAAYPLRYSLTAASQAPSHAIVVQMLHGLTFGGLYVVSTAYLAEAAGGAAGLALSLYTVASNLGGIAGGYLLAYVASLYGFRIMYLAAAAISSLSLPLLLMAKRWLKTM